MDLLMFNLPLNHAATERATVKRAAISHSHLLEKAFSSLRLRTGFPALRDPSSGFNLPPQAGFLMLYFDLNPWGQRNVPSQIAPTPLGGISFGFAQSLPLWVLYRKGAVARIRVLLIGCATDSDLVVGTDLLR